MRYVENEGAVFRIKGPSNAYPDEVWNDGEKKFVAYKGDVPKPVDWGVDIPEDQARELGYLQATEPDGAGAAAKKE